MKDVIKILLIEDSEDDAGLLSLTLKRDGISFDLIRVETQNEFESALDNFIPDVILSDHALPSFNSIDAYKVYLERKLHVPFILVTGTVSEEFAVNVLKQGVDDYVIKANLSRLPSAILNAIAKRRAELETIQAHQTLKLQNIELTKVNQELDGFVYSVSHNLRSPLLSVLGLINLLSPEVVSIPEANHYLNLMRKSVLLLDDTLRDILEYSHNVHDQIEVRAVDVDKLMDTCFDNFIQLTEIHQITKSLIITKDAPLYSDKQRLLIILKNIISNAINYRDEAKEKLEINVAVWVSPVKLSITVKDNGQGIDSRFLPDVYKMFFRANEKSRGAGLGLYVVKEIVGKLHGKVEITSEIGIGTTIVVEVPNATHEN